jgi:small-conductance mechanosensitive channel
VPAAAPPISEACDTPPGALCRTVFDLTNSTWLASAADVLLATPAKILLILVVAFVVRTLLHRFIRKTTRQVAEGQPATVLRPLRGRARARAEEVVAGSRLLSERRQQRAETVGSILRSITTAVVFGIALVTILGELGINLAPIVASAGIVGIAVGFGAQNLVRDFLTGLFMFIEDQYGVGDVIDVGAASGSVEAVGLRTTRLRDVNGVVWHIPNGEIKSVGNMSQQWSRAVLDMPVAYGSDVEQAREVIKEVADGLWHDPEWEAVVLEEPEVWGVEAISPDGLVVRLVVKTAPLKQWDVARELRQRIKLAFDAAGVEIPVPQRSVRVRTDGPVPPEIAAAAAGAGAD